MTDQTKTKSKEAVIELMATRKGVRKIAVENFLGSLDGLQGWEIIANLKNDARLYKWNATTVNAIKAGIVFLNGI